MEKELQETKLMGEMNEEENGAEKVKIKSSRKAQEKMETFDGRLLS